MLAVTNMYPTDSDPVYGIFVRTQMESIRELGVDVEVRFVDGRRRAWRYATAAAVWAGVASPARYDLVHAHYGLTGFVALLSRCPLVVSFCGDDLLGTPDGRGGLTIKSRVVQRLSYVAARQANAIICKSEGMRLALPDEAESHRAHVIPNGVNTRLFRPAGRLAARRALGLNPDERLVLFPNTPSERRKRVDLAEAGVAALREMGYGARLWVITGVPPERMPLHYQAADCLLLTSDWEGSPNVVKEALCCDLPVVSVDVGDVVRWLDQVPGCPVVGRSAEGIAGGLRTALSTGRVDGEPVRKEVALDVIAKRIVEVYREAITRG